MPISSPNTNTQNPTAETPTSSPSTNTRNPTAETPTSSPSTNTQNPTAESPYPEQRHAGKVGYGPNFNKGATFADRVTGLTEELHGRITHNPQLVKEGHEKHTGDAARRKALGLDDKNNPFASAQDEGDEKSPASETPVGSKSDTSGDQNQKPPGPGPTPSAASSTSTGKTHTSDINARQQAATVTPQETAQSPKTDAVEHMKSIDEGSKERHE